MSTKLIDIRNTCSCAGTSKQVMDLAKQARNAGLSVDLDRDAGTIRIKDGDTVIYRGLQKGRNGMWIVNYNTQYFK